MWSEISETIRSELSDLSNPSDVTRVCLRLFVAAILGGVLGWERESHGKSAGLRTHMLVSIGACLFVLVPQQAGASMDGISRVIQGLVAGIGFIGAGAILHQHPAKQVGEPDQKKADAIIGLTTAAGLWLTAAIGVAAGLGRELTAILSTVFALIILSALLRLEKAIKPVDPNQ